MSETVAYTCSLCLAMMEANGYVAVKQPDISVSKECEFCHKRRVTQKIKFTRRKDSGKT